MKKTVTNNGLLLGGIMAGIFLLFHFINPGLNLETSIGLIISIAIPVFFMRKGVLEERALNEENMSFGEVFTVAFQIFVIGTLISTIVSSVMIQLNPIYMELATEKAIEAVEKTFEIMGRFTEIPEDEKAKALEEVRNQPPKMGIGTMILGYFIQLLFPGALIAAIMGAVFKKG